MQTENESFSFSEKKIANSAFDWLLFHHWNNITINYMNNLAASVLIGNGRVHPKSIQTYHRFRQAQIKKKAFLSAQWMCHLIWIYSKFWSAFIWGALKGFNIQYLVCYETASRRSVLQDFTLQKAKIYTKCNVLINIYYSSLLRIHHIPDIDIPMTCRFWDVENCSQTVRMARRAFPFI